MSKITKQNKMSLRMENKHNKKTMLSSGAMTAPEFIRLYEEGKANIYVLRSGKVKITINGK